MLVFVGYGYNERDKWIEDRVFPILKCVGFTIVHGKDMHGLQLQPEVTRRLDQSDAAIGFFTIREGQGDADFTSHIWVRDEMMYAIAKGKPIIVVRETGTRLPDGLLGNRQYVPLDQNDRLACVAELLDALGHRQILRVKLDPSDDSLRKNLWKWRHKPGFAIRYRTRTEGLDSEFRNGRLECLEQGFYLNLAEVPSRALVEVEGVLNNEPMFGSGWVSSEAVQIRVF